MTDDSRYEDEVPAEPKPLKLADVFRRAKLRTRFVDLSHLDGWAPGEGVWIRELTAGERSKARSQMGEYRQTEAGDTILDLGKVDPDGDAKLVWWATLDSDAEGNPVPDSQMFDTRKLRELGYGKPVEVIQNMGSGFVDAVVKEIREISGLNANAKDKEKKG
jgi:hypothetical protein